MKRVSLLIAALMLSGCAGSANPAPTETEPQLLQDCSKFTALPAGTSQLPDLEVECLQGSAKVNLSALRGPMLIPIWASWCVPCSDEMPVMELFQELYGDYVPVLGLALMDESSQAIQGSQNWGVYLPSLEDPDGVLRPELGFTAPPTTLFINEQGEIVHREFGAISGMTELKELVREHLDVTL